VLLEQLLREIRESAPRVALAPVGHLRAQPRPAAEPVLHQGRGLHAPSQVLAQQARARTVAKQQRLLRALHDEARDLRALR
jgi:hypothetical protein